MNIRNQMKVKLFKGEKTFKAFKILNQHKTPGDRQK